METQFIDKSINKNAVNNFFKKMESIQYEVHTIQIYKNNKCILRIAQPPYSCTDAREVYSLSKTFTSSVVGIASDMGLLSVDDYVLDFFPEIKTDNIYFKNMKIKHVLSMNTGHSECVMPLMHLADKAYEGFFSKAPDFMPGTHFAYNTGATCLLGEIVSRVTKMHFFDFACEKLFYPLGIYNISWSRCHDGSCQCGTGLHISNDDIIKLGLLYFNNGIYNGKRILSEKWIEEASSAISDNSGNGTPDWTSGYGYQIWKNNRNGYRGDGAFGQFCLILPKYDAVVAVQAIGPSMQDEIDTIFELLDNIEGNVGTANKFEFAPLPFQNNITPIDKIFKLDKNPAGFSTMQILLEKDMLRLSFSDGIGIQTIFAGNNKWLYSEYNAKNMIPLLTNLMTTEYTENIRTAACFKIDGNKIIIFLRYLTNPHTEYFELILDEEKIKLCIKSDLRAEDLKYITGTSI